MAFKNVRNLLLIKHNDGLIDDDEFVVLYDLYASKDLDFLYDSYTPFDLEELDEYESFAEFRFGKRDIRILKEVLEIPDMVTCSQRSVCDGLEGLCMLLNHGFAKPIPVLSMITNQMIDYVYNVHGNRVLNWNHEVLSSVNLQTYVDAVTARGAILPNCFGFIDGTVRPISRPVEHQQLL